MTTQRQSQWLRLAFAAGALTDALALLPMLFPALARLVWGLDDVNGAYRFALGYGAALMLGWTVLLGWACQRPIERRGVAALTMLVIAGFVVTEILAVWAGWVAPGRLVPTWVLQALLSTLFGWAYWASRADRPRGTPPP